MLDRVAYHGFPGGRPAWHFDRPAKPKPTPVTVPTGLYAVEILRLVANGVTALRDIAPELDADVVMFVHRPIQAKPEPGSEWEHYAKLSIAKNRQGRCGLVSLFYQGDQTRFDGWAGNVPQHIKTAAPARRGFASGEAF